MSLSPSPSALAFFFCCSQAHSHPSFFSLSLFSLSLFRQQGSDRGAWLWCSKDDFVIEAVRKVREFERRRKSRDRKRWRRNFKTLARGILFLAFAYPLVDTPSPSLFSTRNR